MAMLAGGALHGKWQSWHGSYWAGKANGEFAFFHLGLSAVCGAIALGLYALATADPMDRVDWLLPVRGLWARWLLRALTVTFGLLALSFVLAMPVA